MRVKYTFTCEIPSQEIAESNDIIFQGYMAINRDYNDADSIDDFQLEYEILE